MGDGTLHALCREPCTRPPDSLVLSSHPSPRPLTTSLSTQVDDQVRYPELCPLGGLYHHLSQVGLQYRHHPVFTCSHVQADTSPNQALAFSSVICWSQLPPCGPRSPGRVVVPPWWIARQSRPPAHTAYLWPLTLLTAGPGCTALSYGWMLLGPLGPLTRWG